MRHRRPRRTARHGPGRIPAESAGRCGRRLHVCLFERAGPWAALTYALAPQGGALARRRDYRILPSEAPLRIEGPPGDPVQADGELVAGLPVEIDVVPDALALVHPAAQPD